MTTTVKAALLGVEHPHSLSHLRTLQALPEVSEIFLWDESAGGATRDRGKVIPPKSWP